MVYLDDAFEILHESIGEAIESAEKDAKKEAIDLIFNHIEGYRRESGLASERGDLKSMKLAQECRKALEIVGKALEREADYDKQYRDTHIRNAKMWIRRAQKRIKEPHYTGDPIKLLNEALVELDIAIRGE